MMPRTEPKMVAAAITADNKMKNGGAIFRIMNSPSCARTGTPVIPKPIRNLEKSYRRGARGRIAN